MNQITVTADAINEAHRNAQNAAAKAVDFAVQCGELLIEAHRRLPDGIKWKDWVEQNCDFALSTAARYKKAAKQKSTGVDFRTLSELYGSTGKRLKRPENDGKTTSATSAAFDGENALGHLPGADKPCDCILVQELLGRLDVCWEVELWLTLDCGCNYGLLRFAPDKGISDLICVLTQIVENPDGWDQVVARSKTITLMTAGFLIDQLEAEQRFRRRSNATDLEASRVELHNQAFCAEVRDAA